MKTIIKTIIFLLSLGFSIKLFSQSTTKSYTSTLNFNNTDNLQMYNAIRLQGSSSNTISVQTNSMLTELNNTLNNNSFYLVSYTWAPGTYTPVTGTPCLRTTTSTVSHSVNVPNGTYIIDFIMEQSTVYIPVSVYFFTEQITGINHNSLTGFTFDKIIKMNGYWPTLTNTAGQLNNWSGASTTNLIKPIVFVSNGIIHFIPIHGSTSPCTGGCIYGLTFILRKI